jgi:hypothetical protein
MFLPSAHTGLIFEMFSIKWNGDRYWLHSGEYLAQVHGIGERLLGLLQAVVLLFPGPALSRNVIGLRH